jgi:peptidoglycan hydrolase-like protein with peptidoglycan-binding domain/surface antigen
MRMRGRLRRSAVAAAIMLLMSGCTQMSKTAAVPDEPSTSAASPPKATPPTRPADPEVRAAQDYLARLGYYRGPVDGIDGPKTRAAVAKYQTDHESPPDGKVSRDLIAQLAGSSSTPAEQDKIDRLAGPLYEPGDTYIYTDGQIETVLSMSERRVQWQDARGQHWSADPDFTVPATRPGQVAAIGLLRPFSWPLRVGATASYTVETAPTVTDRDGVEHWQCAVESREQTSVAAGTFDSYKIVCQLDGAPVGATQSRTWYYAPAIGHYVRYIDNAATPTNGVTGTRSRDLVAVSPGAIGWPSEAKTGLEWAVSHALEAEPDGQPVPWQSSAVAARFIIEPGGQVTAGHSGQCRRFSQTRISADATKRIYPGVACRIDSGHWRLLGLDHAAFERAAASS